MDILWIVICCGVNESALKLLFCHKDVYEAAKLPVHTYMHILWYKLLDLETIFTQIWWILKYCTWVFACHIVAIANIDGGKAPIVPYKTSILAGIYFPILFVKLILSWMLSQTKTFCYLRNH